ncbi:PREDICTED: DNA-binding protein RFX2-like isoform X3 [Priapulus caudatus]|uniref:DNA-binding protein RFX2-like isoform X3 n=1 Tax=Priapulus caudatus TaxID=37621 RepID=A0ABM1DTM8_PRICU|nr:PREDICTED: DNA-binding protein RFX2-like isoform X3 [Priapulus caudatus]
MATDYIDSIVGMATQTFVSDMQVINTNGGGAAQQASAVTNLVAVQPANQQQQQQSTTPQANQAHSLHSTVSTQAKIQTATLQPSGQQVTIITAAPQPHTQPQQAQQFVTVADGNSENTGDTVTLQNVSTSQPANLYPQVQQVQYVEATDPSYTAANGEMAATYYSDSTGTMYTYTPVTTATYYATNTPAVTNTQQQVPLPVTQTGSVQSPQVVTYQGGGTYLVQGGFMDNQGHPLTHTTRASPTTVSVRAQDSAHTLLSVSPEQIQWLLDNYETAEGVSLPRSTLYNHYLRHCSQNKLDPVNAASFGKLIRSVFLGLRTRRLGTRGNSKYHYYGIRIKASSPLNAYSDDVGYMAMRQQPVNQGKRFKSVNVKSEGQGDSQQGSSQSYQQNSAAMGQNDQHRQYLGEAKSEFPNFDCIDFGNSVLPEESTEEDLKNFQCLFKEHCESVLDVVLNLQFSMVESLWQGFWRTGPEMDSDFEEQLPKDKLYALCKSEVIQKYVRTCDYQMYQALVEVLIPDVLRPIPSTLTQAIRNFAKSLEGWLSAAMQGVPEDMIKVKLAAVNAFAQTLRRYTSLNHLAQAARAVLQNSSQISQMLTDLNRVDFNNVQASWVCQCDEQTVTRLEQDFKLTLQQQNSLEQWAIWLEGVVTQVLKPHEGTPNFAKAARQFLLKWSFYSSMVIRDLTLRSAASFGSFHLIRLLYDEYMFYLVEHRVAESCGETPIAVMGEFVGMGTNKLNKLMGKTLTTLTNASSSSVGSPSTAVTSVTPTNNNSSHKQMAVTSRRELEMLTS